MSSIKIIGIVFARMASKRLPRKALLVAKGKPLIAYALEKALKIQGLTQVVLATSTCRDDDELVEYAQSRGFEVFRGSSDNVALRALDCAKAFAADAFIRINGDSPYLDPQLISSGLSHFDQELDMVSNLIERTFPYGVAVEIIKTASFEQSYPNFNVSEREHITQYFYRHPQQFRFHSITQTGLNLQNLRQVVDTPEDFERFLKVLELAPEMILEGDYQRISQFQLSSVELV